ncbi:hypothetical protein [Streptomyces sp. NPDC005573]|uniref:hypothetical protein n=1 Tax=Streptomyces sp. NPDC005573 TaxID=3156890 RepID=UPI0033AF5170
MNLRGRRLRFTAVLAVVVLALTGFSRHGHSRHGGGSGGGCSSSHQDHDGSSSSGSTSGGGYSGGSSSGGSSYGTSSDGGSSYGGSSYGAPSYGDTDGGQDSGGTPYRTRRPTHRATSTPTGTSSGTAFQDGTVRLISCATASRPYATVEITNPNGGKAGFRASVTFYDVHGNEVLSASSPVVTVAARGSERTRVPVSERFRDAVDRCAAEPEAEARR